MQNMLLHFWRLIVEILSRNLNFIIGYILCFINSNHYAEYYKTWFLNTSAQSHCYDPLYSVLSHFQSLLGMLWLVVFNAATAFKSSVKLFVIISHLLVEPNVEQPARPCDPSPCGHNALCNQQNGAVSCVCPTNYIGDPYTSCRPECVLNTDCPRDKSCVRNLCIDPCAGTCGINAECRVSNHVPVCSCKEAHTGDPYGSCRPIPVTRKN